MAGPEAELSRRAVSALLEADGPLTLAELAPFRALRVVCR